MISELKKQIAELDAKISGIQAQCSHPPLAVVKVAKADTGNYDPSTDRYWNACRCGLCEKTWEEPQ